MQNVVVINDGTASDCRVNVILYFEVDSGIIHFYGSGTVIIKVRIQDIS